LRKQAKLSLPKMAETFSLLRWEEDGKGIRPLIPFRYILPEIPVFGINFKDCDLRSADFGACQLKGADFSNTELARAKFIKATLHGANFKGANRTCTGADFHDAKGTNFHYYNGNFFVKTTSKELDELDGQIENVKTQLYQKDSFELFNHQGPSILISTEKLYSNFAEYIDSRKQRKGLWFFQLGNTCDSRKLAFILAVGQLLVSLTNSLTSVNFKNLTEDLTDLREYINTHTGILRTRIFGNSEYSLFTYFETLFNDIQTIGKIKSQPARFTDAKNRVRLNSAGKKECAKLSIMKKST
jgi:uncharacterized protein YjbI with pentapeptide repeats